MKSTITAEATEKNSVKSVLVWKRFDKNSVLIRNRITPIKDTQTLTFDLF